MSGKEGGVIEEAYTTPHRDRQLRMKWEQDDCTVQQRWRSKEGSRSIYYDNKSSTRLNSNFLAMFDNGIIDCNNRIRKEEVEAESVRIWDLGKKLGTTCSREVGEVISEPDCMKMSKEGINIGVP